MSACKEHGLEPPKIAEKNDFFDVEILRPAVTGSERLRPNTNEEQPELQPELEKLQPEFKAWIDRGLEKEQQELQQESLYGRILGKFLKGPGSTQDVSKALGQKSISGALYVMMNKLREDGLIEWTIPEKPKSSKQKYKLTKKGLAFYLLLRKEVGNE